LIPAISWLAGQYWPKKRGNGRQRSLPALPPYSPLKRRHYKKMLSVENVSKIYQVGTFGGKELHAVSGANFEIHPGEVVSLIGESGSGKSTIGKMMLRLLPISAGKITYNGRDISTLQGAELKEYYRNVQGIFQDPFSSYNPIFKVGRVYKLIRETFFPGMSDEEWNGRVRNALHAVGLNPD